ncbi:DUF3311 domain-containing protein [Rhizobium sp. C4]|uniref:DUF3311 domain-containing protein n=1 Tax=Rhizobium sp. C4 TaxID=1349800 RepID=UPI001E43064C|nr:DUF3311 domain-containing protein [Rhizobium sp. C4]MCD2175846.1 DUF3311 domain-containing protein [Rhizobium sp. C4]
MRYILLLIPCVASVATWLYNISEPMLFGIPFFYWFLMLLIPVSSIFIWLAARTGGDEL